MSLLKIKSNAKTKFTKIISKMEEQKLVISKLQSVLFLNYFFKRKSDYSCHLASKLNNSGTSPKTYWSNS